MDRRDDADPFAELKEAGPEYRVYDPHYEKVGKVDDLLVDEDGRVLYIGVKTGFFGTNTTLVPAEIIRVNDRRRLIEVFEPAETIRHALHFSKSEELTPELENHVRTYFGLETLRPSPEHDLQGPYVSEGIADRSDLDERARDDPREDTPEPPVESGEPTGAQERTSGRSDSEGPISERLSDEPRSRWARLLTTDSGVTVHRIRTRVETPGSQDEDQT